MSCMVSDVFMRMIDRDTIERNGKQYVCFHRSSLFLSHTFFFVSSRNV